MSIGFYDILEINLKKKSGNKSQKLIKTSKMLKGGKPYAQVNVAINWSCDSTNYGISTTFEHIL